MPDGIDGVGSSSAVSESTRVADARQREVTVERKREVSEESGATNPSGGRTDPHEVDIYV